MKRLSTGLMGLSLAATGFTAVGEPVSPKPPMSTEASLHTAFGEAVDFWQAQGVGEVAATQLVILDGTKTTLCDNIDGWSDVIVNANTYEPSYCPDNDIIALPIITVEAMNFKNIRSLGNDYVVHHELGHKVQNVHGLLARLAVNPPGQIDAEVQATCYAGASMAGRYEATDIHAITDFLRQTNMEADHGTSSQQADAFLAGAQHGLTAC